MNISEKLNTIRDLRRFLQPGLISCTTFDEKLGFLTANHERMYKFIMALNPNGRKPLNRTETSLKLPYLNLSITTMKAMGK